MGVLYHVGDFNEVAVLDDACRNVRGRHLFAGGGDAFGQRIRRGIERVVTAEFDGLGGFFRQGLGLPEAFQNQQGVGALQKFLRGVGGGTGGNVAVDGSGHRYSSELSVGFSQPRRTPSRNRPGGRSCSMAERCASGRRIRPARPAPPSSGCPSRNRGQSGRRHIFQAVP